MLGVAAVPCLQGKKQGISPIQPFSAKSISKTSTNSVVCKRVPCATEQGINSRQQGSNSALSGRNREFGAWSILEPRRIPLRRGFLLTSPRLTLRKVDSFGRSLRSTREEPVHLSEAPGRFIFPAHGRSRRIGRRGEDHRL